MLLKKLFNGLIKFRRNKQKMKHIIHIVLSIVLLSICNNIFGQNLKRKGMLGIRYEAINDSIAKTLGLSKTTGILIKDIIEGYTASKAKLHKGDVITAINENEINSSGDLLSAIAGQREGYEIVFEVIRKEKYLKIITKVVPKPYESYKNAEVIYDEIPFSKGYLRCIIDKPADKGKYPAIFFIQGYTCSSIDNMGETHAYDRVLRGLLAKGYVIFKTEKPGMGDCQGTGECDEIDFFTELSAFQAAYDQLDKYEFIDRDNIFIFGHSIGGVIASLLKQSLKAKGIAVYGTVVNSWFEYFVETNRLQNIFMGADYMENDLQFHKKLPFLYEFMVLKKSPKELAKDSVNKEILEKEWQWDGGNKIMSRNYLYWQQLQEPGQIEAWKNTGSFVLSIWGAADFVAFSPDEHKTIADVVNYYHPGKGKYMEIPEIDHSFTKVADRFEAAKYWFDNEYRINNFNPAIIEELDKWMKELMNSKE